MRCKKPTTFSPLKRASMRIMPTNHSKASQNTFDSRERRSNCAKSTTSWLSLRALSELYYVITNRNNKEWALLATLAQFARKFCPAQTRYYKARTRLLLWVCCFNQTKLQLYSAYAESGTTCPLQNKLCVVPRKSILSFESEPNEQRTLSRALLLLKFCVVRQRETRKKLFKK